MSYKNFLIFIIGFSSLYVPHSAWANEVLLQGEFLAAEPIESGNQSRLAVFTRKQSGHDVSHQIEWFSLEGDRLTASGVHPLWKDAVGYDLCKFHKDEPAHLLIIRPDGIYRLGASAAVLRTQTVLAHRQDERLPRLRVCFDFGADGRAGIVVPVLNGIEVWRQDRPNFFQKTTSLPVTARMNFFNRTQNAQGAAPSQKMHFSMEFPEVSVADFDGSGRKDVCLALLDQLKCYFQSESGKFSEDDSRTYDFNFMEANEGNSVRYVTRLVDLNQDGRMDVVLNRHEYNLTNMQGQLHIYRQTKVRELSSKPDQTIARSGFFGFQDFIDLNGNGFLDIVAPVADLGWTSLAGIFLRKTATVQFIAFSNVNGKIDSKPVDLHSISYPVDFKNFSAFLGALPLWNAGILPSESRKQAMFYPGQSQIEVYAFDTERFRLAERLWRHRADVGSYTAVISLNSGRKGLLMAYPFEPEKQRKLALIVPG